MGNIERVYICSLSDNIETNSEQTGSLIMYLSRVFTDKEFVSNIASDGSWNKDAISDCDFVWALKLVDSRRVIDELALANETSTPVKYIGVTIDSDGDYDIVNPIWKPKKPSQRSIYACTTEPIARLIKNGNEDALLNLVSGETFYDSIRYAIDTKSSVNRKYIIELSMDTRGEFDYTCKEDIERYNKFIADTGEIQNPEESLVVKFLNDNSNPYTYVRKYVPDKSSDLKENEMNTGMWLYEPENCDSIIQKRVYMAFVSDGNMLVNDIN